MNFTLNILLTEFGSGLVNDVSISFQYDNLIGNFYENKAHYTRLILREDVGDVFLITDCLVEISIPGFSHRNCVNYYVCLSRKTQKSAKTERRDQRRTMAACTEW